MTRPYCDQELADIDADIDARYKLSKITAFHTPCNHKYAVKKGGKKEQYLSSNINTKLDDMTCSVCFKLRNEKTVGEQQQQQQQQNDGSCSSNNIYTSSSNIDDICDQPLTIAYLKRKDSFYKWLYQHNY